MTQKTDQDASKDTGPISVAVPGLSPLLVGVNELNKFILANAPLVDKTEMIHALINGYQRPYFLARPRRFGKTFLLDTLHDIFAGRQKFFTNLAIGKDKTQNKWRSYPVIRLDMTAFVSERGKYAKTFIKYLKRRAAKLGVKIETSDIASAISSFIEALSDKQTAKVLKRQSKAMKSKMKASDYSPSNVVLLIDEYDAQMLRNITDPILLEEIMLVLHDFYSSVKSCIRMLRFVLITGITKFQQLSLSSSFNMIDDITFNSKYSTICGFTETEIRNTFPEYLKFALEEMKKMKTIDENATIDDLMRQISWWYDGYSWDGETRLLNPDSVKNFLENCQFGYYWYLSGIPLLTRLLKNKRSEPFKIFDRDLKAKTPIGLEENIEINSTSFLLYSGYLTISDISGIPPRQTYQLKIPNNEIKYAIEQELTTNYLAPASQPDPVGYLTAQKSSLLSAFCSMDEKESERLLTVDLNSFDKTLYHAGGENYIHLMLGALLKYGDNLPFPNPSYLGGKPDLVFPIPGGNDRIIIEIKYKKADRPSNDLDDYRHQSTAEERQRILDMVGVKGAGKQSPSHSSDRIMTIGHETQREDMILSGLIDQAFAQIVSHDYAVPLMRKTGKLYVAAIGVYDISKVRVRFAEVVWVDKQSNILSINALPSSA
ncbi:MAG: AAA family ATPase [Deltaproteobacteria bacterium]|nr:AAA family ATPase [Deltaproteobacteria bacterium]